MSEKSVVIVESPAKAKTIEAYLGKDYKVLASYGHIRDLPSKNGSVDTENNFAMSWAMSDRSSKPVSAIKSALKSADKLILATDPDREGEAISWHIQDMLEKGGQLKGKKVERVAFNAVTKSSIIEAFSHPRQLDQDLVDAYMGRRALDYLVGFSLSPILWRKLPGSRSAGRVQSVALRIICDREHEIEKFIPQEYWSILAQVQTTKKEQFWTKLTHLRGEKLDKFTINNEVLAKDATDLIDSADDLAVIKVEQKETKRQPYAPFITSSLQMEASRKLGFGAARTMRLAQQLYEGINIGGETAGLITYMRTDGISLSPEAITQARSVIEEDHGKQYVPSSPRVYKSKSKNAQEAHEAIRPTDIARRPVMLKGKLDNDQWRLYDLIWKRTVASQMEAAIMDRVAADIAPKNQSFILRANGQTIKFPGFLALYTEDTDDKSVDDDDPDKDDRRLPRLIENDALDKNDVQSNQHFTQPPPRYSEASLVKKLEEEGIGRPSTYASIIQVLQDRNYVRVEQKRFFPEDRGRIVTVFLKRYFPRYVELDFTASMEEDLDKIAEGKTQWRTMLAGFWKDFQGAIDETKDLRITEVIDELDAALNEHFFPPRADGTDPKKCPKCDEGRLSLKLGKFGAFIGCTNYGKEKEDACKYTQKLDAELTSDGEARPVAEPMDLGKDPKTGRLVSARPGPYGPYVQIDADPEDKKSKPKRQGLPKGMALENVTFEEALDLLALPREVGIHPDKEEMIKAGIGRFGPFLVITQVVDGKRKPIYISMPKDEDILTVTLSRAVEIVEAGLLKKAQGGGRRGGAKKKAPAKKKTTTKKKTTASRKPAAKKKV